VKLETKYMAQCFSIISVSFQQRQEQRCLIRSTFERLQNHIEDSIWIQI